MIESIWAKNLLCFDENEHRVDCAPLTVLVGPNNSGKSAMIAGFNLLRDSGMRGGPYWETESYNIGDFTSAVHKHETNRAIEVGTRIRDGENPVTLTTSIQGGLYTGVRSNPNVPNPMDLLRQSWYFRASRSDVSKERQTQQGGSIPIWGQQLDPYGSNIITYLLERWTDQDKNWPIAQDWLRRIDPELSILKSPLRRNLASLETTNKYSDVSVNLAYQGTGIQKALTIIAGVIFSPPGHTLIIEEPEVHLERGSIEGLVDLFNYAVMKWNKQIIISTHSIDLLLQYASDLGLGTSRGGDHARIDESKFKLVAFERQAGKIAIREEDMKGRFTAMMDRLRAILKPAVPAKVAVAAQ